MIIGFAISIEAGLKKERYLMKQCTKVCTAAYRICNYIIVLTTYNF